MRSLLPFTLIFLISTAGVTAGNVTLNGTCSQSNNKIDPGTLQLLSDCQPTQFCNSAKQCQDKGCRKDDFPFGYAQGAKLPAKCPEGQFCPDEGDACQPLQKVGDACQLNRDDECEAPPNFKQLAGTLDQNFNGSICLKTICTFANITVGQTCIVDNTPFIGYGPNNNEFIDVVSRGNCQKDLWCDSQNLVCMQKKALGVSCDADKECQSDNCMTSLVCGVAASAPKHFATWVYIVVALAIVIGMIGTLVGLYFIHSKSREQDREKRMQYWREQNAFRQNILQMRETARTSIMSYPRDGTQSNRSSRYGLTSEDSQIPMLQPKGSGLRNQISEDEGADVGLIRETSKKRPGIMRKLSLGRGGNRI